MQADWRGRTGQVSMEYTMLMGALLLALILILIVMMGQYAQSAAVAQERIAEHALATLAAGGQEVWVGGPGASKRVQVELPTAFDSALSQISGRTLQLYLTGTGDVSRQTYFNVSGYWPARGGMFYAELYNNNTSVVIRPAGGLLVNLTGIYASFASGGSAGATLLIVNQGNVSYQITQTLTCPADATCTYAPDGSTSTLDAGASITPTLSIGSSTTGLRSGYLVIDAVPAAGSGLMDEELVLPVTLRVD